MNKAIIVKNGVNREALRELFPDNNRIEFIQEVTDALIFRSLHKMETMLDQCTASEDYTRLHNSLVNTGKYIEQRRMNSQSKEIELEMDDDDLMISEVVDSE
jgi:hypothetical protein